MALRILTSESVHSALPMHDAIRAVRMAYTACSLGRGAAPERTMLELPGDRNVALFMPGLMDASETHPASLVIKAVTVFPSNPSRGLPMNQGALLAIDTETGAARGLLDTATITAIRTAAGSAVAADCLARQNATTLSILGTGVLAPAHIEAILTIREVNRIQIWGRTSANAMRLAEWVRSLDRGIDVHVAKTSNEAVRHADIICTLTPSENGLFSDDAVASGTHINAVGAFRTTMCELPAATIGRASVFVDQRSAAMTEAGDLIQAERSGAFRWDDLDGEIGEVVSGVHSGRSSDTEITVFKSVGISLQDAAVAHVALANAEREDIGHVIDWP